MDTFGPYSPTVGIPSPYSHTPKPTMAAQALRDGYAEFTKDDPNMEMLMVGEKIVLIAGDVRKSLPL